MNSNNSELLNTALAIAQADIPVLPLQPRGKAPVFKWAEASTDPVQIEKWWNTNPEYNIGILTGEASGIVVLDFDTEEAWQLCKAKGLPDAPTVKTGKGYHLYCKFQVGLKTRSRMLGIAGFDIRSDGGLIVVPPSMHENGTIYTWVEGSAIGEKELGILPEWLFGNVKVLSVAELVEGVSEGNRHDALVRIVGSWLHNGMSYDEIVSAALEWNTKNEPPEEEKQVLSTIASLHKKHQGKIDTSDEWDEPLLFSNIDTPEIPAELLPSWLGAFAKDVSRFNQTPEGLAVMAGLSAVATCVQKRFEVSALNNDYKEILALWTVTVLPPSERKSPVLNAMTAPIVKWEREQRQILEPTIRETNRARSLALKRIDKLEKDIIKEEVTLKRVVLLAKLHAEEAAIPHEVREPCLWTSEGTPERLQDMLAENDERVSLLSDEGGIFDIMAGMYSQGKVNIDVLLNGYTGSPVRIERRSRRVDVHRPAVTFGITVQPHVIESFSNGSKGAFRGKGALARFLYCIPKPKSGTRFDDPHDIPYAIRQQYEDGLNRLLNIPKQIDANRLEVPRMLVLSEGAVPVYKAFRNDLEKMIGPHGELHYINDWAAKLAGNMLRIAGLMHLVEFGTDNLVIGTETVNTSVTLCLLLIEHAKYAFGVISNDESLNNAKKLFNWIEKQGFEGFSKTTVTKALEGSFPKVDMLNKALKVLEDRNIIRLLKIPTPGRTSNCYMVNPKVAIIDSK